MISVELLYDADCPNVENARTNLLYAFHITKLPPEWKEWIRSDPKAPAYACSYGSPTILINGQDVAGTSPSDGVDTCRLYADEKGQYQGAPEVETIASVLSKIGSDGTSTKKEEETN
jgi:hypothetical protein